jgi:hypothetical protein
MNVTYAKHKNFKIQEILDVPGFVSTKIPFILYILNN